MLKLKKHSLLLFSLVSLFQTGVANADDLTVSGTVLSAACNIDTSNADQTITFEDLYNVNLREAGSGSNWKKVDVLLTNCPAGTKKVTMTLSGTPAEDNTYFANTKDAANVVLQITDPTYATTYKNGSTLQTDVDASHDAAFELASRIYSPTGNGTAGAFESVIMVNFTYQ
ncbi:fimbrial protein [Scandinavium goeteborgense]|uniref:fimbrial protein n=1 Tax=Scandinavium goeteborgense TaxID=1851514 RepID=UPI0037F86DBD